jgi:hypothetical protein
MSKSSSNAKIPKDIQEMCSSVSANWEQKLAETEACIVAANSKSFDLGLATIVESHGLLKKFSEEKSKSLAKTALHNNRRTQSLSKLGHGLQTLEAKLHSIDQAKALDLCRKKCIAELEDDVSISTY